MTAAPAVPAVLDMAVGDALVRLPWGGPDQVIATVRITPAALTRLIAARPELAQLDSIRGVPVSFVEAEPAWPFDWSIRCELPLRDLWTEHGGPVESLLDT